MRKVYVLTTYRRTPETYTSMRLVKETRTESFPQILGAWMKAQMDPEIHRVKLQLDKT